jgi:hypothetical protein
MEISGQPGTIPSPSYRWRSIAYYIAKIISPARGISFFYPNTFLYIYFIQNHHMIVTAVVLIPDEFVEKAKAKGMSYAFIQESLSGFMRESFKEYMEDEDEVMEDLCAKISVEGWEEKDTRSLSEKLRDFLDTEEGAAKADNYFRRQRDVEAIYEEQLRRIHERFEKDGAQVFREVIDKILAKYESEEYYKRWYGRGMEPPKDLLWYLKDLSNLYGRDTTQEEWEEMVNEFTGRISIYHDHAFMDIYGQGAAIILFRREKDKWERI